MLNEVTSKDTSSTVTNQNNDQPQPKKPISTPHNAMPMSMMIRKSRAGKNSHCSFASVFFSFSSADGISSSFTEDSGCSIDMKQKRVTELTGHPVTRGLCVLISFAILCNRSENRLHSQLILRTPFSVCIRLILSVSVQMKPLFGITATITRNLYLDTVAPAISAVTITPNPVDAGKTYIISVSVTD